ncbi:UNVERIFIED_CONTAM: hypothetical protein ABIE34_002761 [Jeotgalibacillus campisalis]
MKRRRLAGIAIAISLPAASLAGCAGQQPASKEMQSFSSMDEAYAAVDEILGCDSEASGNPVVPMGDGANWMVVDLSNIAGGQSSTLDLESLADKVNGEYAVVGS